MTRYTKRVYLDKQPEVGDRIVTTHANFSLSNRYNKGNEMTIVSALSISGDCILAFNERTGKNVYVHDSNYAIFRDVTYEKVGEEHIVKRFLGIPIYSKKVDIYKEASE
ncbi:hypothetical protein V7149_00465 [Bacillus sp. JJ1503]|uniref:hypothetical protein n=1 Tax=Bacillus sp. JJ1503 TaxID=3122956 RepID=UPI002FFEDED4